MSILIKYWESLHFEDLAVNLLAKAIELVLLIFAFIIGKQIANWAFDKFFSHSPRLLGQTEGRRKTLIRLFHNVMDYFLYFLLIYWILAILGLPVSSLLAGAGIAGLAIGLGAQGFLSDLVNGFFILIERQFDVGDSVTVDKVSGIVSSVGIRTTEIRDFDGTLHFIPNREILLVSNKSRGDMRAQIDIPIYASTNLDRVTQIIKDVNETEVPKSPEIVGVPNVLGPRTATNGQFIFRVDIFVQNGQQAKIYSQFYRLYQEALLKADISLPTPNTHSLPRQKS
ncbi:mechanosensitive ion channel family protein [Streptococcus downei]|uniref:Mechanosensitive ion channel protein n=1 Tax=Streptococcus downei MFe28 TaxID=764290 RepID=A0A380JCN1_STRDO|nr:mechanosensitive ion channel family protein [Streptococcus downei]EFQ56467.1 transporter, small conductance mechanosensitive ion channel MscS family protein [Streptococcus downei F0415]SUN35559.1 mechanosensitive ion channel protein [Streptococcus downei MFe28]